MHAACVVPRGVDPMTIPGFKDLTTEERVKIHAIAAERGYTTAPLPPTEYFEIYTNGLTARTNCSWCQRPFINGDAVYAKVCGGTGKSRQARHTVVHHFCVQQFSSTVEDVPGFQTMPEQVKKSVISRKRNLIEVDGNDTEDEKDSKDAEYKEPPPPPAKAITQVRKSEAAATTAKTNSALASLPKPVVAPAPVATTITNVVVKLPVLAEEKKAENAMAVEEAKAVASPIADVPLSLRPSSGTTRIRITAEVTQPCCGIAKDTVECDENFDIKKLFEVFKTSACQNCGATICRWCTGKPAHLICKECHKIVENMKKREERASKIKEEAERCQEVLRQMMREAEELDQGLAEDSEELHKRKKARTA
jgi:hypothetical protein